MEKKECLKSLLKYKRTTLFISRVCVSGIITQSIFALAALVKLNNFIAILGAILSFFFMRSGEFILQKFFEKKADPDDFSYIKEAIAIVFPEILLCLFILPIVGAGLMLELNPEVKSNSVVFLIYCLLFSGILIFSYRIGALKTKLLNLQAKYKNKEHRE